MKKSPHPRALLAAALAAAAFPAIPPAHADILSSKRGFADVGASYQNLQATNAGWYYTWGTGPASPGNYNALHYPMFWSGASQSTINNVKALNPAYVLGFNEPERPDQANMTVAQAIAAWTPISNSFTGTNTKLVSPAVADTGGAAGGQQWLANFMSQAAANNLKVDAVAFHWYGVSTPDNPSGAASSFLSRVDSYFNSYGKPVFITEFAIHDWGGNYTDAQIIEANRQFLNIVIPALESRAHVAGYAWYHWFSDAPLYTGSGSNLTPTPMSYAYIGAVGPGTTTNLSGQNLGEHVAPLTGGTLTMTGPAAGTVKFINALAGTSALTGSIDWSLAGTNNWTRIQPGATLAKTGANQITLANGTFTNNGTLDVTGGNLRLGAVTLGNGIYRVSGGSLTLFSASTLNSAPLVDVRPAGTLHFAALNNSQLTLTSGRTLHNDGIAIGNLLATSGSLLSGGGSLTGNITAQSGATVRVGKDGTGTPTRLQIDSFSSYAQGAVATVASPPWTAHAGTTEASIQSLSGNNALAFGSASTPFVAVSRQLPPGAALDNLSTATYFFRLNAITGTPNHNVGLGDVANTGGVDFADFEAQLRIRAGTNPNTIALDARSGGAFSATLANNLPLNTWFNIWMVVNNATDRFDLYLNTGTAAATAANKLNASQLAFRNGTADSLTAFLAYAGAAPVANGVRLDDLTFHTGLDLSNPTAGFNPGTTWTAQTFTVNGNYTQLAGSTLELNLFSPAQHDSLKVTGTAALAGTLAVTMATGAPTPQRGDTFPILDAAEITGAFSSLSLPALPGPLAWALSDGTLVVANLGDATLDGKVDAFDLNALAAHWQKPADARWSEGDFNHDGIIDAFDLNLLAAHWQLGAPTSFESALAQLPLTPIPEPASLLLLSPLLLLATRRRTPRP